MKYLIWATPRTGSTLLCDMLHQTKVAGICDFTRCGFPLGAQSKIEARDFAKKLKDYEASQTSKNGVFGAKLSWDGLAKLCQWVGVAPVQAWLNSIDVHIYLYRKNIIDQAVSLYIANKRRYFTTMRKPKHDTPPYSYDEIAFRVMLIKRDIEAIRTYFFEQNIAPISISFETLTRDKQHLKLMTKGILTTLGQNGDCVDTINPQIKKQVNHLKGEYYAQYWVEHNHRKQDIKETAI